MRIVFRTDASLDIGLGHAMRCLTLAKTLSDLGADIEFVTRKHPGNMSDHIQSQGFKLHLLPIQMKANEQKDSLGYGGWLGADHITDAQETIQHLAGEDVHWLVIDHYSLNIEWESLVRPYVKRIMVIDDLAARHHDCDILLDQTYGRRAIDYTGLAPNHCKFLLGSKNALLRPEFSSLRVAALKRRDGFSGIKHIMISMGGLDEANMTSSVLDALRLVAWEDPPVIDVVLTSKAPFLAEISELSLNYPYKINLQINAKNMAELMLNSDLAIGAGGTTSWERCSMALPAVLIVLADNQKDIGKNLMSAGATITLQGDQHMQENIKVAIEKLLTNAEMYADLCSNASVICDGQGVNKVAKEMLQ